LFLSVVVLSIILKWPNDFNSSPVNCVSKFWIPISSLKKFASNSILAYSADKDFSELAYLFL
jgi:hypothetical protein